MGGSTYSSDDYAARVSYRASVGAPVFKHHAAVSSGRASGVHPSLDPKGVKVRESRDSDAHPVTVPVAVIMDTTGSMAGVPPILEKALSKLMGTFLDDKASGKRYLGDGYPAVLVGAIDDYTCTGDRGGTLQLGQFESGIEIDNDLENILLTAQGGGSYEESYELALYFFARHTAHDHWEKRGRKGYLFLIGDEHPYPYVSPEQVAGVIGDTLQARIAVRDVIAEVQERYHVFFIIPNMTSHYSDVKLRRDWSELGLGQNVLLLEDPSKVCELIAATVALCEENVGLDDLAADDLGDVSKALVAVGTAMGGGGGALAKVSADKLPAVSGVAGEIERL